MCLIFLPSRLWLNHNCKLGANSQVFCYTLSTQVHIFEHLAFADGLKVRLNRIGGPEEKRETYTKKAGTATIKYYKTITAYEMDPEVLERLKNGIAITKIRVVFKENDVRNYEIAEGYQARMASDLLKSFLEASQKNKKANGDLSDEDF